MTKETIENCFKKCGFGSSPPLAIEQTDCTDVDSIIEQHQDFELIDSPSYISSANGIISWQEIENEKKEPNKTSESDDDSDDEMHPKIDIENVDTPLRDTFESFDDFAQVIS